MTYKSQAGGGGTTITARIPADLTPSDRRWISLVVVVVVELLSSDPFFLLLQVTDSVVEHFQSCLSGFEAEMLGNLWMLCLCLCSSWAEAHIWAWMLNMPHSPPKEGAKALREHVPVAKAPTVRRRRTLPITLTYQT